MRIRPLAVLLFCLGMITLAYAQGVPTDAKPHAPMELLGMGPEMFQDRTSAWIEAIGKVSEQMIAKLGIIALAVIAVWRNIITNAEIKGRLDRQGERIDKVAIAVPAVNGDGKPIKTEIVNPPEHPIPTEEVKP